MKANEIIDIRVTKEEQKVFRDFMNEFIYQFGYTAEGAFNILEKICECEDYLEVKDDNITKEKLECLGENLEARIWITE